MKKKIRIILSIVIIIIIFNFIIPNCSYAFDGGKILSPVMDLLTAVSDSVIDILQKVLLGIKDDAFVNIDRTESFLSKFLGAIAALAVAAICIGLAVFFSFATGGTGLALIAVGVKAAILSVGKIVITYCVVSLISSQMLPNTFYLPFISISPENILQNKISLFDVNFFEEVDTSKYEIEAGSIANDLHNTISKWYYTLRTIVMIGFMLVLLYLGIRILITGIASEKAKYKNMLSDWLVSFCLLFVIHYIMIFSMQVVNTFTDIISSLVEKKGVEYFDIQDDKVYDYVEEKLNNMGPIESPTSDTATPIEGGEEYSTLYIKDGKKTVRFPVDNFMTQARIKMQLVDEKGGDTYETISWSIIYIMLTIYTVKFVFVYLKRLVYIAFLILVSPLVVLTYSIDKLHDGQAQGFNTWLKEYLFNLSIQPFHLLLYIIFVSSAMELSSNNPIYVLVVMGFITQAEKILRKMFGFEKATTPGVLSGALGTGLAMSTMQKLFGRKPPHISESSKGSNSDSSEGGNNSRIREQNIDNAVGDGTGEQRDTNDNADIDIPEENDDGPDLLLDAGNEEDNGTDNTEDSENIDLKDVEGQDSEDKNSKDLENTENTESSTTEKNSSEERAQVVRELAQSRNNNRQKAKFKLGRAMKGAARHYVQTKGKRFADRVNNTSLLRSAAKAAAGGAAALTAGTAGVLLGAADGSPEKALRNAGAVGAVAYKGVSDRIEAGKVKGMQESFIKAGYGSDYKQYKQEVLAKELKHNLENRTVLEDELGWDKDEINKFFEETMDEYIKEGVKTLDDMIIGEKLKLDKVASTTKQAISVMYLGQQIGTDTRSLTKKKKEEWAETIISKSPSMSKVQSKMKDIQRSYDSQIKKIQDMNLEKAEEQSRIAKVQAKRDADKELTELTKQVKLVQTETFKKLDKYSKYKYK